MSINSIKSKGVSFCDSVGGDKNISKEKKPLLKGVLKNPLSEEEIAANNASMNPSNKNNKCYSNTNTNSNYNVARIKPKKTSNIADKGFLVISNLFGISALVGGVALAILTQNSVGIAIGLGAGGLATIIGVNAHHIYNIKKRENEAEKEKFFSGK